MTRERLDAHPVESEYWLFPCGLSLTIRVHDGEMYLAIQTGKATQRQPAPETTVLDDPSYGARQRQSSDSKLAFVWRQLTRIRFM